MNHTVDYVARLRDYFHGGTAQKITKNTIVLSAQDDKQVACYIASGFIRIYSVNGRGEQYTHIIYGPGEIYPLIWLIRYNQVNTFFETLTDAEIYCVPLRQFTNDLRSTAELSYAMMQQAVEQYRVYSLRVDNLEYKYASERLAYCLILLANRFGERSGSHVTIVPPMTHQLLGSTLNLSRESVSREMEKLVRKGLVQYNSGRQIVIPDMQVLADQLRVPFNQGLTAEPQTLN